MNPTASPGVMEHSDGGIPDVNARTELPVGAFLNKSVPEAIELYLSSVRQKQTGRQVADALKAGGLESKAKKFDNAVNTALHRLMKAGKVLRFSDGWALARFYPPHIRTSAQASPKTSRTENGGANGAENTKDSTK